MSVKRNGIEQGGTLRLERCPHCGVAKPNMTIGGTGFVTELGEDDGVKLRWVVYRCATCGQCVLTSAVVNLDLNRPEMVLAMYPDARRVSEVIPERAREYLEQTIASAHAPAGAVMLAASAVDAMLKEKGYEEGVLNSRIEEANKDHLITDEMAAWAHEVRLDANDQRHPDKGAGLPTQEDARSSLEFALALAEFLFVLPARVERGRKDGGS